MASRPSSTVDAAAIAASSGHRDAQAEAGGGLADPVGEPPAGHGAQCQPGDEHRHHQAEGVGRRAEDLRQQPRPDHLQRQRDEPRHPERERGDPRAPEPATANRPRGRAAATLAWRAADILDRDGDGFGHRSARQHPRDRGDAQVQADRDPGGGAQADRRQQDEAREQRPQRRTDRVGRIQGARRPRRRRRVGDVPPGDDRERGPHRHGRYGDEDQADEQAQQREGHAAGGIGVGETQERRRQGQEHRHQQRQDRDGHFESGVEPHRGPAVEPIAGRPGDGGADRQAAHERGQHGAGGRDAVPEIQRQQAGPGHFVDQCRRARRGVHQQEPARGNHPLEV